MSFGIVATVAAGVGGALISAQGAKKAARAQGDAAAQQLGFQQEVYDQAREDQAPYRDIGYNALYALTQGAGMMNPDQYAQERFLRDWKAQNPDQPAPDWNDPNVQAQVQNYKNSLSALYGESGNLTQPFQERTFNFTADPGYQFRIGEGQKQIESSAAARGGLLSGAAAKALTKYNQNFASNEYGNAFNRFQTDQNSAFNRFQTQQSNQFNRLATLAGVGQNATNATQAAGQNFATGAGNAAQYGGDARASGYAGQANALASGLGTVGGGFNQFMRGSVY